MVLSYVKTAISLHIGLDVKQSSNGVYIYFVEYERVIKCERKRNWKLLIYISGLWILFCLSLLLIYVNN